MSQDGTQSFGLLLVAHAVRIAIPALESGGLLRCLPPIAPQELST
jgi:hypothetical protein